MAYKILIIAAVTVELYEVPLYRTKTNHLWQRPLETPPCHQVLALRENTYTPNLHT